MSLLSYQNLVRSSAIYDLVFTAAFAIPGLAALKIGLLGDIHHGLGLSGSFPVFDTMHLFFVHLLGAVVVVWSVLRLVEPRPLYGLYDSVARFAFTFCMALALAEGGTELVWFFLIPEFLWGGYQLKRYSDLSPTDRQATELV